MRASSADLTFLNSLGFDSKGDGTRFRVFRRGEHILCLLPDEKSGLAKGIQLYRPQRMAGKVMVAVSKMFRFVLPAMNANLVGNGPISKILDRSNARFGGLLLGNPSQAGRRGILLLLGKQKSTLVVKIGTTGAACEAIRSEREFMEAHGEGREEIPRIKEQWSEDSWEAFAMDYCEGRGDPGEQVISRLLSSWLQGDEGTAADSLADWTGMLAFVTDPEERDWLEREAKDLKIIPSLRHGDFTPWNLFTKKGGDPMVIDWEFGRAESVPGWDLVHYYFYQALLVEKLSPSAGLKKVRSLLEGNSDYESFLVKAGWEKRVALLMKSYFYSMKGQLDQYEELAKQVRK